MTKQTTQELQPLIGGRFGRLTSLDYIKGSRTVRCKLRCICDCGNVCLVSKQNAYSGKAKSCGCISKESFVQRNTKHGMRSTPEYRAWCGLKSRCLNTKVRNYKDYGGRGITVCEEWVKSFSAFHGDMGDRPSSTHSIERIDVNGNYEPSNCKWIENKFQARNKRKPKNNTSGIKGISYSESCGMWIAYWHDLSGRQNKASFSESRYGDKAKVLAVMARDSAINYLNTKGAGYAINK
jgi:hypothetical protein